MSKNKNRYLVGANGHVWLEGDLLANLKSIESKISMNFNDVSLAGTYNTDKVYTGWAGEGSLTLQKVNSKFVKLLADGAKTGNIPTFNIITKLEDKNTGKSERYSLDVIFTELTLGKFEGKDEIEEELPFTILDYEVLTTI
ncbi:phage tail tube protein [Vallitalea sediminicola]